VSTDACTQATAEILRRAGQDDLGNGLEGAAGALPTPSPLRAKSVVGRAGISIRSNDLTQLLLGADRDSGLLAELDERDPAVVTYLKQLIPRARALGLKTSICGQAPSVHLDYADLLVRAGIDAISAIGVAGTPVVTVRDTDTLDHAAELMKTNGVTHLAVLSDRFQHPAGILSTLDVARAISELG
jgi:CBS domain containing-hemolysin-like protein